MIRSVQDDIADRIQTIRDQQVDYPSTYALRVLANLGQMTGIMEAKPVVVEQLEETDEDLIQLVWKKKRLFLNFLFRQNPHIPQLMLR